MNRDIKILVACEESGTVVEQFINIGYKNVWSCDILPCSGKFPNHHLQQDVVPLLSQEWDLIIAHPPCNHLSSSGAKHFAKKIADGRQQQGIDFFMLFTNLKCKHVAIENPIGIMSTKYRKPDQIIQPWMFGDPFQKTTCLWLKGLPLLIPTKMVDKGEFVTTPSGKRLPKWYSDNKSPKNRSKTFIGIAKAIAQQYSEHVMKCLDINRQSVLK